MSDKEYRKLVKRTVIACEGCVKAAAELLGVERTQLSRTLNQRALGGWWISYKRQKQIERAQARTRRAYLRRKERALVEAGYHPDLAYELARRPRPISPRRRPPL